MLLCVKLNCMFTQAFCSPRLPCRGLSPWLILQVLRQRQGLHPVCKLLRPCVRTP